MMHGSRHGCGQFWLIVSLWPSPAQSSNSACLLVLTWEIIENLKHTHTRTHTHTHTQDIIHTFLNLLKGIQWFLQFWPQHESTSKIITNHKVTIKGCKLQVTCKTLMGGSWFAWVSNFLYALAVFKYFQMLEKFRHFHDPFHLNIWIAQFFCVKIFKHSTVYDMWH